MSQPLPIPSRRKQPFTDDDDDRSPLRKPPRLNSTSFPSSSSLMSSGLLLVRVIEAKDLLSSEVFGHPSAFCQVSVGTSLQSTPVVPHAASPFWGCDFEFLIPPHALSSSLLLSVWHAPSPSAALRFDHSPAFSSPSSALRGPSSPDDPVPIGRASLSLPLLLQKSRRGDHSQCLPLSAFDHAKTTRISGDVYLRFSFFSNDQVHRLVDLPWQELPPTSSSPSSFYFNPIPTPTTPTTPTTTTPIMTTFSLSSHPALPLPPPSPSPASSPLQSRSAPSFSAIERAPSALLAHGVSPDQRDCALPSWHGILALHASRDDAAAESALLAASPSDCCDVVTCQLCTLNSTLSPSVDMLSLPCAHDLCSRCVKTIVYRFIAHSPGVLSVACSVRGCVQPIPQHFLKQILTAAELSHYLDVSLDRCLQESISMLRCPACHVPIERVDQPSTSHYDRYRIRCRACSAVFCSGCDAQPYHDGYTCKQHQDALLAPLCRFCSQPILPSSTQPTSNKKIKSMIDVDPVDHQNKDRKNHDMYNNNNNDDDDCINVDNPNVNNPNVNNDCNNDCNNNDNNDNNNNDRKKNNVDTAIIQTIPIRDEDFHRSLKNSSSQFPCCSSLACTIAASQICQKVLECGHPCSGAKDERHCPPCLHPDCMSGDGPCLTDLCAICYVDPLATAPCVQLHCGHVFHLDCVRQKLTSRWATTRITFTFACCPLCQAPIEHEEFSHELQRIKEIESQLKQIASRVLRFEEPEIPSGVDPIDHALSIYAFYMCMGCRKPFFAGRVQCGDEAPQEALQSQDGKILCTACQSSSPTKCAIHGPDFIHLKCQFCCSVAAWRCWGTTSFCDACHKKHVQGTNLTKLSRSQLPKCPGPLLCSLKRPHPPPGIPFSLGCFLCDPE